MDKTKLKSLDIAQISRSAGFYICILTIHQYLDLTFNKPVRNKHTLPIAQNHIYREKVIGRCYTSTASTSASTYFAGFCTVPSHPITEFLITVSMLFENAAACAGIGAI